MQNLLFTPFIQEGGALNRDQVRGGLGLGLYYAKLLVERQDGNIWFETEKGEGSTFYFSLPKA